ncbi:uncharacterized protein LMH87_008229 [Akanthomyces muscarius]|uniref:Uncharacterized protein n=1 Tax=Akanthomyces muscarius TaxID=2231603 RepID=A0A9W8QLQ2_AKAMU|nr:uncharacterized protein LMH87_008229 [Akanthomyces muscarius]KAJ4159323.1 hypothetical protein LMH87_008229 [Akanthomyces muscarius]
MPRQAPGSGQQRDSGLGSCGMCENRHGIVLWSLTSPGKTIAMESCVAVVSCLETVKPPCNGLGTIGQAVSGQNCLTR